MYILSRAASGYASNANRKRESGVEGLRYYSFEMLEAVRAKPNVGRQTRTRQRQFTNFF